MNFKRCFWYNEEPGTEGGGGSGGGWRSVYEDPGYQSFEAGTENAPDPQVQDDGGQGNVTSSQGASASTATKVPEFDYEKLAGSIGAALAKNLPQGQQQQRPQLSEEEQMRQFRQATKYFQVTEDHVGKLFGENLTPQQRAAALQELLDAAATHAITTSRYMVDFKTQDVQSQFQPLLQQQMEQKRDTWIEQQCKEYKGLEKAQPLFKLAMQQLMNSGYQPRGQAEDTKAVLGLVEQFVKAANPKFSLVKSGGQQSSSRTNRGNMPGSVTGAGGGGAASGPQGARKPWMNVYHPKGK